jgi:hypothetical protein
MVVMASLRLRVGILLSALCSACSGSPTKNVSAQPDDAGTNSVDAAADALDSGPVRYAHMGSPCETQADCLPFAPPDGGFVSAQVQWPIGTAQVICITSVTQPKTDTVASLASSGDPLPAKTCTYTCGPSDASGCPGDDDAGNGHYWCTAMSAAPTENVGPHITTDPVLHSVNGSLLDLVYVCRPVLWGPCDLYADGSPCNDTDASWP